MTLTDAGPLIAIINRNDPHHGQCSRILERLPPKPLVTTWPAFTEAMYLLHRAGGHPAQQELWGWVLHQRLVLRDLIAAEVQRAQALMARYLDRPMDLADATLVTVAESDAFAEIFTVDGDFTMYRMSDGRVLTALT